jgi:hypothetical protein
VGTHLTLPLAVAVVLTELSDQFMLATDKCLVSAKGANAKGLVSLLEYRRHHSLVVAVRILVGILREVEQGEPVVIADALGARPFLILVVASTLGGVGGVEGAMIRLNHPHVVDDTTVQVRAEECRVGLDLLPVDMGVVVDVHP